MKHLISFFKMQRGYNGYNYDTFEAKMYFSLIRVLKSKKKEVSTNFVILSRLRNIG